jgi:hypothetical protein
LIEEIAGISRTGRRFGVILNGEDRILIERHPFDCPVIEVLVGGA